MLSFYDYCTENGNTALISRWDHRRNGELTPTNISYGSHRKVWWRCEKGHEWEALIRSRSSRDSGCPYCTGKKVLVGFNDLAALYPTVAN